MFHVRQEINPQWIHKTLQTLLYFPWEQSTIHSGPFLLASVSSYPREWPNAETLEKKAYIYTYLRDTLFSYLKIPLAYFCYSWCNLLS